MIGLIGKMMTDQPSIILPMKFRKGAGKGRLRFWKRGFDVFGGAR